MSKFSGRPATAASPVRTTTTTTPSTVTHEGGPAYIREAKGELFLTALTTLVEDTFYESEAQRSGRLVSLVHQVTAEDPTWVARFAPWLRTEGFMRSAPIVIAAEYVKAGGPNGRAVVASVLQRADEPAEMLGYWHSRYGRNVPQPIKRGVADAIQRLYTEKTVLKYDGNRAAWRFGDVIEMVHPKPVAPWQSELFKFCLDRRRHDATPGESLARIGAAMTLEALPEDRRRSVLKADPDRLAAAGFTWERLSGWLPGGMDAEAWEAIIPSMGYMALLRNLRNFDQAGISVGTKNLVQAKLADPEQVARSMQFPFRFYSAWKQGIGLDWAAVLEIALDLSAKNVPELSGRSLVIVDVSGSMTSTFSRRGSMAPLEAAMIFGAALYARNPGNTDLVGAATTSAPIEWRGSILRTSDWVQKHTVGEVTYLGKAVSRHYQPGHHDRVFLFTDGQSFDKIPDLGVPVYLFNLNAYRPTPLAVGHGNMHELGGLSDATFKLIPLLEQRKAGVWPHMDAAWLSGSLGQP